MRHTDEEGSFSGRLVVFWGSPAMGPRSVMTWKDVRWNGPKSHDLLVQCQCPSPVPRLQVFRVRVTVNNLSDRNRTLTLTVAMNERTGSPLLCLDHSVLIGNLMAKSKTTVWLRFMGLASGVHCVSDVSLRDLQGQHLLLDQWLLEVE